MSERLGSTVVYLLGAHWMGFTFVADCTLGSPVALHLPSRGRSFRRLPAKRPNWLLLAFHLLGLLVFGIAPNPESSVTRSRHMTLVEQAPGKPETKGQSAKD